MSVNKIVTKVDGTINKTIDFNDLKAGLSAGAHTITVEAYNGATLISTQTRNITIAAQVTYEAETTTFMNTIAIADDANSSIYTGVSNNGVWLAINEYITDLKTAAIYNKQHYNYLKIGDTATKQAVDLIDPTRSGQYFGSWIFGKDGATANGTNCYFKTFVNPITLSADSNNFGSSIVVNSYIKLDDYPTVMGIYNGSNIDRTQLYSAYNGLVDKLGLYFGGELGISVASPTIAFHTFNRIANTAKYYSNGVEVRSANGTGYTLANGQFYEGGSNWISQNNAAKNLYKGDLGVSVYHQNLTASETLAFSNAVSKLETALGRKRY